MTSRHCQPNFFQTEKVSAGLDFRRSQVPGEAFVAAARQNPVSKDGAVFLFREAGLMLPSPVRRFLWEDFIFNRQPSAEDQDGGGNGSRRRNKERPRPKKVDNVDSKSSFAICFFTFVLPPLPRTAQGNRGDPSPVPPRRQPQDRPQEDAQGRSGLIKWHAK